ncbi:basic amino acid ABC transporter substrate-binding protein [Desulfovibrio litoralis]|uniref:Amino acid ABC transporter substrate-binding protein, PAAT family n=1 Tax=Desulfovibrio litoralis DSM 11393 TaxID=1121455 RepID=A0A1M7TIX8_9BACT|nr:basic amino acid ABC transporter substrate-binding protein [Desulfovibrio litoralis]SHN70670.1 amino acid ABC transporter substrate-binding protein, PAAT family [Desulfovibrio litoralis DSM 11393]
MLKKVFLCLCCVLCFSSVAFAKDQTLIVAHDATWAPMEFASDNKIVGYSVDYIDAVAKEAGFKVDHKAVAWDGIFAGLSSKRYDLISSSVTITPERKANYDFSTPYAQIRQAVIVPINSNIKTAADLKGKTLGAQVSTTGHFAVKKIEGATDKPYDEIGLAMEDLKNGRTDGVVCDDPVAAYYANKRKDFADKLKIAFIMDGLEEYGFVVRKDNKEVLDLVNKGVKAVKEKGIEAELQQKWFGKKL